jgi:hypothetical protein
MQNSENTAIQLYFVALDEYGDFCVVSHLAESGHEFSGIRYGDRYVNTWEIFDTERKARNAMQRLILECVAPSRIMGGPKISMG